MSGNPPKLPPGISLQRTPAAPAPNLPPGISIQRSGDAPQLQKLPSSIQIQRPDSNESSAGMDRLAGLGIQISRSEEKPRNNDMDRLSRLGISVSSSGSTPSPPQVNKSPIQNQVPDRLSGLGISVSGGPKPQGISISGGPRLPPGVNVSGGPKPPPNLPPGLNISGGSPQNLPPGVNISGGPRPPQNFPPGMSISGGPRPKGPPGVNMGGGPRPNMPPGVNISGGPRPNLPPGVNISGGPRPAQGNPPGVRMMGGPRPPQMNAQQNKGPRFPPGVQISGGPVKKPDNGNPQENGPETDDKDDEEESQDSQNEEEGEIPKENGSVTPGSEKNDQEKPNDKEDEMDTEEDEGPLKVAEEEIDKDKKSSDEKTDDTQENGEKEKQEDEEESEEKDTEKDTEKEKPSADKSDEKEKKSKTAENGAEGEEGWEGYEGEGWEGYEEGGEGWEGYEDEEGWEGYEGEEGWEGYEEGWEEGGEKKKEGKEKKDGKPGEEGEEVGEEAGEEAGEETKDAEKSKEDGEEEKEEGEIEKADQTKSKAEADPEDEEDYDEEMEEEEDTASSVSKDTDGAPKTGEAKKGGAQNAQPPRGLGSLGNISISRLSKEDDRPKNKLPPGISMSPVPSLPPGISISSPSVSGPPSNLPPGISISPFKKPSSSVRHSVDDDSRSVNSMDRDNSFYREDSEGISDSLSIRSYNEQHDPEPLVGTDTTCVFCMNRCGERKPKLLTCLHSSCSQCFDEKIRISIRDNSANDVVDIDGDDIQMAPEVTCSTCKATTSEDEVMDNYFASADDGEDEETPDEDQHICNSCEENAIATSKCNDCEEYLCNDCVRAHLRVKMTKDHEITVVATSGNVTQNLNYCDVHRNEKLTLFCESCDTLNCRDCQLSERHRNHKYRYSHEVAPEIKAHLMQSVSDIRLKKNGLEESRQLLSTKLTEVNIKENSLLGQLREVKSYLVSKIENRHKELVTEITKVCREKRKLLEGRKSTLDRTFWQADYGITFVKNVLGGNASDEKMLLTKRMMSRQMKRLRRANNSVNLSPPEMEMKLDLYFQHFTGQSLHTNLDSVLKMVMSDIKISNVPVEAPKPKPPPTPAAPSPVRQPPTTPTRGMPQSPGGVPRTSPARMNSGLVNRNLGTPQKQIVARSPGGMRQPSPVRPMMQANRNMQGNRMQGMQPRMSQPARGGRGRGQMVQGGVRMGGQQGGMMAGRGQMGQSRGRGPIRGGMVGNQGMTRGGNPQLVKGRGIARGGVQQMGMRGGNINRGGMQMRGGGMNQPRMIQPAIAPGARRGRPPSGTGMNIGMKRDSNAIQPLTYNPSPRSQNPQSLGQRNVKPNIASLNAGLAISSGSSWHTPTTANRPVSPPKSSDASSFKIKLPKMGGGLNLKAEADADIISLDEGPPAKIVRPNGTGNVSDALATLNRTGIQISRQDDGVDPLGGDQKDGDGSTPMVSLNLGAMKSEPKAPSTGPIKIESGQGTAKHISQPTSRPIMEGSAQKEKADGDWCAVCHDGGDTLYCCDRCPKVYHLFCYVPPLTSEPPDDWVCLMCATIDEILSLPTKVKKGRGNLSERDLKLCRRLLFEMYNLWPESVPFRDCADLNFPQYLEKIKDPIALDVIKERLDEENPDQYSSVREFLADLRKMFRNCFLFNSKESEIYRHAKKLEEKLDQLLQMWLPEFAFDPLTDLVDKSRKTTKSLQSTPKSAGPTPPSPQPGPSKKKRSNDTGVDFLGKSKDKKKKKKKKRKKYSDDNRSESDSDEISEGERERQDYLAALQMSLQGGEEDNDPRDGDFMPDEGDQGKGKGKGKGRGKGKRAAS
eukprot:GFUD01009592.1.p1 GENE.GFUD01009592.1~~GFUD01009592.1.p1  ORF type:complete len:1808 (+),score=537.57 GFUD01009592.1:62-5485(+)